MAANFAPHMGGPGQMMQQRPQQQRQAQPGGPQQNATTQIQQVIFQTVNSQTGQLTGWQSNVLIQERIGLIFSIIGNLRLASQNTPTPPGLNKMIEIGIKFEKEIFHSSPDKNSYKRAVEAKLEQLLERRHQNQAGLQQTINQQAQAQAQAQQQQAQQQQMMMNQNGMTGQGPRAMPQQPAQQGFQHLQHQMQASPLPGQQPQQMPMGMANDALPPNMTPNQPQQPFQMPMQQSQQQQPQAPGPPMTPQENAILMEMANRLMQQAPPEEKNQVRANITKRMDPNALNSYAQRGQDPVIVYYRNQALNQYRNDKKRQQLQQQLALSQGQNMSNAAPSMQHQRSMNPSPLNGQTQPPTSMGGNGDFGFLGNMDNIANQQQQGINAQESGQVVVPANGAQRNATPQPGGMPGQQMGHPNNRISQQHLLMQQRMQAAQQQQQQQQQQSQAQARMNAQSKAAQMGLQGQPGGMGNGPMPPQQSPAMATLNAPLRTPSQMSHTEAQQANSNPAFGQPLDQRFAQGNPRVGPGGAMNVPGFNPALFNNLTQQQRQEINGVPPDKLNEVMHKWNEQRQLNASNMVGRPPIPMPGNNQGQPGQQVPQPGPFNSQNPGNQFNMNGQRPQQPTAMTPQQTMLLQQQIARLQQSNTMQRGNVPPGGMANEQRMMAQMDTLDIPPNLLTHQSMPRGIPPEVKKWGPLKAWVQQNPTIGPEYVEGIKNLQKAHWSNIMRARAQQAGQAGAMQPPGPGGQATMPTIPAGMNAPVAPMGQPPMQFPNGMNVSGQRQIGMAEINSVRNHPSGKMLQASDEQIRMFLMKQQMSQGRQQQQAANMQLQNQQMQNHLAQMNGQPPRPGQPGQPPQNLNARGPNQPPAQVTVPKQPAAPEAPVSTANASNANRGPRPQPSNARNAAPTSSPAQPANKLKRASSDDVVEISNPNNQQPARTAPQQPPVQKQPSQQGRQQLTQAQVAALDPEARRRYEMHLKMERFKTIAHEDASIKPAADIYMDQETKANVVIALGGIIQPLQNMGRAVMRWYQVMGNDARLKQFFRLKSRVLQQYRDTDLTQPKDVLSIGLKDIDQGKALLQSMVEDLSKNFPEMMKGKPQQSARTQAAPTSKAPAQISQPVPAPPVQLSAANLQQQQQQLNQQQQMNKMHQRSNSRSSHAPAAPTSAVPPYQFGAGSPTPAGVPAYATKQPQVTRESLHIPAKKRQKQESKPGVGQATPGSNASPNLTKAVSPEVKRQAEPKQPPKPSFTCSEPDCERHNIGFESAEALQAHNQQEHTIGDPLQYALQNLGSGLNLDAQGRAKIPPVSHDATVGHTAAKMSVSGSKQGQTPNMKTETTPAAATPMNRQVSMNRQSSSAGTKQGAPSKATPSKDVAKTTANQKDASKQQAAQPSKETTVEDPWANATIDPHDLFQAFQPFETGAGGAISDMTVYRSITPNDTPESSKDGVSEPNSDISDGVGLDISLDIIDDKWMPFGPSGLDTFFDNNNYNIALDNGNVGDVTMFDEEQAAVDYGSWDDMVDQSAFDKPFVFDTSLYSMNAD